MKGMGFVNYCLLHNISAKIGFFKEGNCKFSGMYNFCAVNNKPEHD